jgi:hypothetical protein
VTRPRRTGNVRGSHSCSKERQRSGADGEDVAFLAFVAPDFLGRETGFLQRHLAQIEARTAAGTVDEFREGVRDAARADVVDREDRILVPSARIA